MSKSKLFLILTILICFLSACSNHNINPNTLTNNWEYLVCSESGCSETDGVGALDLQKFEPIDSLEDLAQYLEDEEGYIWIKNTFDIPEHLQSSDIALSLGRITIADETYLNGEFLGKGGQFPPDFFSNWNQFRYFALPKSALNYEGTNTLLIKIFVLGEGSVMGEVLLDEREVVQKIYKQNEFLNSNINIIIFSMLILMSAYYLFMYFMRRKDRSNLYFAVLSISTAVYLTNFFISKIPGFDNWNLSYITFQKIIFISVFVSSYSFVCFVREFLGIKQPKWQNLAIILATIIPIIIYIFLKNYKTLRVLTNYLQLLVIIPLAFSVFYIVTSLFHKNKDTNILILGISPVLITVLFDLIVHQALKINSVIYLTGLGLPLFLVCILFILSGRFVKYHNEVEELNVNLEKKVLKRTNDLNKSNIILEKTLDELKQKNEIAKKDMEMAQTIQSNLFPKIAPNSENWELDFRFKPMSGVSGDLYDFYMKDDFLLGLTLLDVSGHGIASGLITMIAKTISRRHFYTKKQKGFSEVINSINNDLISEINDVDNYLTGIFLRFKDNYVEYVNAGHADLIHKRAKTGKVTIIENKKKDSKGWFLGIADMSAPYKSLRFKIEKDDILFLYTDCLNESVDANNEQYGVQRILDSLQNTTEEEPKKILDSIMKDFYKFIDTDDLTDDLTTIVLKKR